MGGVQSLAKDLGASLARQRYPGLCAGYFSVLPRFGIQEVLS